MSTEALGAIETDAVHAEKMNRMYRYTRHVYDLSRKFFLFGRDTTIVGLAMKPGQSLLELGCGTGRNLLKVNASYPGAKLYGLDISTAMLDTARKNFASRKLDAPVMIIGDAAAFKPEDFGVTGFDRIMISYALSMIPEWQKTLEKAVAALAPGGSLHVVDFGQMEKMPHWFERGAKKWLASNHVTPRNDLFDVMESLAEEHGGSFSRQILGPGYAWCAIIRARG